MSFTTYQIRFQEFVPPLEISVVDSEIPLLEVPKFSVQADRDAPRAVVFEPNRAACLVFQRNRLSLDAGIEKLKSFLISGAVPQIEMLLRGTDLPKPKPNNRRSATIRKKMVVIYFAPPHPIAIS